MDKRIEKFYDESYLHFDISIYIFEDLKCNVDVKHPCGEIIKSWEDIDGLNTAINLAKLYIYSLGIETNPHCNNEYCIEQFNKRGA